MLKIATKSLQSVLAKVKPALSTRTTLPILGHVRLGCRGSFLTASATDCTLWIDATTDCVATDPGQTCLPFKRLSDAAALFKGESVTITVSAGAALVECGTSRIKLPVMDASEYPEGQRIEGQPVLTTGLPDKLKRLVPFCSDEPTKGTLQGVLLTRGYAVASLGVILLREQCEDLPDLIIPSEAAATVGGWTGEVTVRHGNGLAEFSANEITLRTKLLEGLFPAWQNTIPAETTSLLTFTRTALIEALRFCASQVGDVKFANIKLVPKGGGFTVCLRDNEDCAQFVESLTPLPCQIGLSMRRLLTLLGAFDGEVISLGITDARTPITVRQEDRIAVQNLTRLE